MRSDISKILRIINLSENLKFERRHSWLSNGEIEHVAEHCWRLSLMVYLIAPKLEHPVDLEKSLKLSIIHDLAEAVVGDIPAFDLKTDEDKKNKYLAEKSAIKEICEILGETDLKTLWDEYEDNQTLEAKFVKALDRLEAQIQHNEAGVSTWIEVEKKRAYIGLDTYCAHDKALLEMSKQVREDSINRMNNHSVDMKSLEDWLNEKKLESCKKEVGLNP